MQSASYGQSKKIEFPQLEAKLKGGNQSMALENEMDVEFDGPPVLNSRELRQNIVKGSFGSDRPTAQLGKPLNLVQQQKSVDNLNQLNEKSPFNNNEPPKNRYDESHQSINW